jgi:hypothetical protein
MQTATPTSWKEEFAIAASVRAAALKFREKHQRHMEKQRDQREEKLAEDKIEQRDIETTTVIATHSQIAEFETKLDTYDTATVELLMENRQAMEAIQERLDLMLENATTLPDGRKVYKTRDGTRVFDQHGQQLSAEEFDPNAIGNEKPHWEEYRDTNDKLQNLMKERNALLEYQTKLDEARNRLKDGDITAKELKDIEAKLDADMPEELREKLGKAKPEEDQKFEATHQEPVSVFTSAPAQRRVEGLAEPSF